MRGCWTTSSISKQRWTTWTIDETVLPPDLADEGDLRCTRTCRDPRSDVADQSADECRASPDRGQVSRSRSARRHSQHKPLDRLAHSSGLRLQPEPPSSPAILLARSSRINGDPVRAVACDRLRRPLTWSPLVRNSAPTSTTYGSRAPKRPPGTYRGYNEAWTASVTFSIHSALLGNF